MKYSYYRRLSAAQRRIYDRSDAVHRVPLTASPDLAPRVAALEQALAAEKRTKVQAAAAALTDRILGTLGVSGVRVRVLKARPSRSWGELQGLYEPAESGDAAPRITVWMRTAQRRQVVAFRTFLRTLLHEVLHHLDYELLDLDDSFHTEGFYRRESSLFRQLVPSAAPTTKRTRRTRTPARSPTPRVRKVTRPSSARTPKPARPRRPQQGTLPF